MIYISIIGLFLSLVLSFYNKGYAGTNRYLGGFFFCAALSTPSFYFTMRADSIFYAACFTTPSLAFFLLLGPFSYFYFRSIINDNCQFYRKDWLHFIPFLVYVAGLVPYFMSSWAYKLAVAQQVQSNNWHLLDMWVNAFFPNWLLFLLRPTQLGAYVLYQWWLLGKHWQTPLDSPFRPQFIRVKRWLLLLNSCSSWVVICLYCFFVSLHQHHTRQTVLASLQVLMTVFELALVLGIVGLLCFPQILYGMPQVAAVQPIFSTEQPQPFHEVSALPTMPEAVATVSPLFASAVDLQSGQSTSDLSQAEVASELPEAANKPFKLEDDRLEQMATAIERYITTEQPFLNKRFSAATMATALHMPLHHISYYYNQHLASSFAAYRNKWRVSHAISLIEADKDNTYTMEAIADLSGFSSKSVFYEAFKNETGNTPAAFQKNRMTKGK